MIHHTAPHRIVEAVDRVAARAAEEVSTDAPEPHRADAALRREHGLREPA